MLLKDKELKSIKSLLDPRTVVAVKREARYKSRKMHELKLGFSEFYLSLVLLQNYQNLNFTGFRKILKKHDKLLENDVGTKWRQKHVEVAPFYTNKDISKLIEETENFVINELEEGDRQRAMKRLRVPPLNDQPSPWTTFKVGFFSGSFVVLVVVVILTGVFLEIKDDWRIIFRLYRGTFLITLFLFLMGINVYGWRTSGVNHVLIFELDPRDHLSEQHIIETASVFSVFWSFSVIMYLYSRYLGIPPFVNPLILVTVMLIYLFNPTPTFNHNARFWLLRVLARIFAAPFVRVNFADFWLADQLNSLVPVLVDSQYFLCFYISTSNSTSWYENHDEATCVSDSVSLIILRTLVACLPAWFRFAQCLRRYFDDNRGPFPHLVNAGKYSTTFFVVIFSTLTKTSSESYNNSYENPFFHCWIISMIISSCYTYIWDIKMDWGLFDSGSTNDYRFLREEIVYSSPYYYYFAIIEDLVLRFGWTLSVSLTEIGVIHADLMQSILAPLEIFRAVRDISVAPIDANDQAKIIKMMDDIDGVTNRSQKSRKPKDLRQRLIK
ncbi:xenotropic and polytropic retrovirus receptor 1-like protein, partial [Dinothrombium tinctorium]